MLARILIGWVALSVPVGLLLGRILRLRDHPLGEGAWAVDSIRTTEARRPARSA